MLRLGLVPPSLHPVRGPFLHSIVVSSSTELGISLLVWGPYGTLSDVRNANILRHTSVHCCTKDRMRSDSYCELEPAFLFLYYDWSFVPGHQYGHSGG